MAKGLGKAGAGVDNADVQSLASANTLHTSTPSEHVIDERRHHKVSSLKKLWAKKGSYVSGGNGGSDSNDSSRMKKRPPLFRKLVRNKNAGKETSSRKSDDVDCSQNAIFESVEEVHESRRAMTIEGTIMAGEDSKSVISAKSSASSRSIMRKFSTRSLDIPIGEKLQRQAYKLPKKLKSEDDIVKAEDLSRELLRNELYDDAMILSEKIVVAKNLLYNNSHDPRLGITYQNMANVEAILVNAQPQRGSYEQALLYFNHAIKCFGGSVFTDASSSGNNSRKDGAATTDDNEKTVLAQSFKYSKELANIYGGMGDLYFEMGGEVQNAIDMYERYVDLSGENLDASILSNLGELYFSLMQYDKSLKCFRKLREIKVNDGDEQSEEYALLVQSIGLTYEKKADDLFRNEVECIDEERNLHDKESCVMLYHKAFECFVEAERIFFASQFSKMIINAIHHKGYIQLKLGNCESALNEFSKELNLILKSIDDMESSATTDYLKCRLISILRLILAANLSPKLALKAMPVLDYFLQDQSDYVDFCLELHFQIEFGRLLRNAGESIRSLVLFERTLLQVIGCNGVTKGSKSLLLAQILSQMGHSNFEIGPSRYAHALGCYQGVILQSKSRFDSNESETPFFDVLMINVRSNSAHIHYTLGNHCDALSCYEGAVKLALTTKLLSQRKLVPPLLNNIANIELLLNDYSSAINHYRESIARKKFFGDAGLNLVGPLKNLANIFVLCSKFQDAVDVLLQMESLLLGDQNKDDNHARLLYDVYTTFGDVYRLSMDHRLACNYYQQAIDLVEDSKGKILGYNSRLGLANSLSRLGNFPKARLLYNQLLISKSKLPPISLAAVCRSMGNLIVLNSKNSQVELEKSINYYSQALEIEHEVYSNCNPFSSRLSSKSLIYTLINLGNVYRKLRTYNLAEEVLKEAYNLIIIRNRLTGDEEVYDGMISYQVIMKLCIDIGKVSMRLGEYSEGFTFLEQARDIGKELCDQANNTSASCNKLLLEAIKLLGEERVKRSMKSVVSSDSVMSISVI